MTEDQTLFMTQEPWLEDNQSPPPVSKVTPPPVATPNRRRQWMIIGAGVIGFTLVLLIIVGLIWRRQPPLVNEQLASPLPSGAALNQDPFILRFAQVKADLKQADPAQQTLPFPPVDVNIKLKYGEQKKN